MDFSVLDSDFFDVNKLTVVASESYDSFAKSLQNEIFTSLSQRPTVLTPEVLYDHILHNELGDELILDKQMSLDLIIDMKTKGYLDENYHITDTLVKDVENQTYQVPKKLETFKNNIAQMFIGIYQTANFKATENENANNIYVPVLQPNENFAKKEFQDLWSKIKVKTVYEVDFDSHELIKKCIQALDENLVVKRINILITTGEQEDSLTEYTIKAKESMRRFRTTTESSDSFLGSIKFDLISEIAKETKLTRKTIVRILQGIQPKTFANYRINPESFIQRVSDIINGEKAATLINNIVYSKTDKTYEDSVFTINNFKGSLAKNILEVKKHVYEYIKTDSEIEKKFAKDLECDEVIVYAKLPSGRNGFKIPTPLGYYSPDWAIVFNTDAFKYVYFIAETKGSMETLQLKEIEEKKIYYAKKHFEALGHADIKYDVIDSYQSLRDMIMK